MFARRPQDGRGFFEHIEIIPRHRRGLVLRFELVRGPAEIVHVFR